MFTLTKINVMWEKLLALTKKVDAMDVEIPEHDAGDAGKYLGVESSGDLDFSDPFPATSGASTGDVLGLVGENKVKGWIRPFAPPPYVANEDVDTGEKTETGESIYKRKYTFTTPETGSITVFQRNDIDLLTFDLYVTNTTGALYNMFSVGGQAPQFTSAGDFIISTPTSAAFQGQAGYMYITFTKPATTLTKKKTTKKRRNNL